MKFKTRNFLVITGILLLFLFILNIYKKDTIIKPDVTTHHQILFISSYSPEFETFDQQLNGLNDVFSENEIEFTYLFMDTKRFPVEQMEKLFYQELQIKKSMIDDFEIIITADDNALKFAVKYYDDFFEGKSIIFFGLNDREFAKELNNNPYITGILEQISVKETLDVILDLYPETNQIIAITDNTTTSQIDHQKYINLQTEYPTVKLSTIDLSDYTFQDFLIKINELNKQTNTQFLLISAFRDKENHSHNFKESINMISNEIEKPIFHLWSHGIGEGIFGGMVVSQYKEAQLAAEMALKVIHGTPISVISVVENSPNQYMFDYKQLEKFNIDQKALPINSVIINKPVNIFTIYMKEILTLLIAIIILSVWILYLVVINKEKQKALSQLTQAHTLNKLYLDTMFEGVIILNKENKVEYINDSALKILGYEEEDLNNQDFSEITKKLEPNTDINNLNYLISVSASTDSIGKSYIYSHPLKGENYISFKSKEIINANNNIGLIINIEDDGIVQRIAKKIENYQEILNNLIEINKTKIKKISAEIQDEILDFIKKFLNCEYVAYLKINTNTCEIDDMIANFDYKLGELAKSKTFCDIDLKEDTTFYDSNEIKTSLRLSNKIGILSKLTHKSETAEFLLLLMPEKFEPTLDWWRIFNLLISIIKNILPE